MSSVHFRVVNRFLLAILLQVVVWDPETLTQQHVLPQGGPVSGVLALACAEGEVWAAIGKEVVVWERSGGRKAAGPQHSEEGSPGESGAGLRVGGASGAER